MYLTPSFYYNMDYNHKLPESWFLLIHRTSCSTILLTLHHPSMSDSRQIFGSVIQTGAYSSPPIALCLHFCEHYVPPLIWYPLPPLETTDWDHCGFPCASCLLCARYSIPHLLLVCQSLIFLSPPFRFRLFLYWNCWNFHILFLWLRLVSILELLSGLLIIPRIYPLFLHLPTLLHFPLLWRSQCQTP